MIACRNVAYRGCGLAAFSAALAVPALLALLWLPVASAPAFAQDPAAPPAPSLPAAPAPAPEIVPEYLRPIPGWDAALDRMEILVAEPSISDRTLAEARQEAARLQSEIDAHLNLLRPRLALARAQAERLGPPPGPGQPQDSRAIAQQRSALTASVTNLSGAINAAEAALLRAHNLSERIREVRRRNFQESVLQPGPSALSPDLWTQVAQDLPAGTERLAIVLDDWQSIPNQQKLLRLILIAVALGAVFTFIAWRGIRRYREWFEPEAPPEWRRVASAGWVIVLRSLPTLIVAGVIHAGLAQGDPLPLRIARLADTALFALLVLVAVQAVAKTVLAINRPHWRLLDLSDEAAAKLHERALALAIVYGADLVASALNEAAGVPYSLIVAQSFVSSIAYAGLIISILTIKAPSRDPARGTVRITPAYLRLPLWLVAIAILVAALLGYVTLARFIAGQLIVISTILTITYLFLVWASAFGKSLSDERTRAGLWLQERLGLEKRRREQVALPITLFLQAAIIVAAIPFILLQWGSDWQDIADLFRRALFGFELGHARISVFLLIAALFVFALGYIAAKIFQGWLDSQVLEPAGVDSSVRHSIRTGVGWLGIALAALLAISYAGLDISSLALVAGALSVGIGFGLQSVVNNFISGLILLAERPVKVGDWIIVGGDEGLVRRISVRSTEIETFERSNVIVPNSMLITEKVKNWTLHNNTGRYTIKVSVHFDADPEKVVAILLEAARAHAQVLSTPEPFVYLEEFGAHSLNFTLYIYLINVSRSFAVRTDLRIAILKAFRAAGIEMPYPQTDVHLRGAGAVRRIGAPQSRASRREFEAESGLAEDNDNGNGS